MFRRGGGGAHLQQFGDLAVCKGCQDSQDKVDDEGGDVGDVGVDHLQDRAPGLRRAICTSESGLSPGISDTASNL